MALDLWCDLHVCLILFFLDLLGKASRTEATIEKVADSIGDILRSCLDILRSLKRRNVISPNESERETKFRGIHIPWTSR